MASDFLKGLGLGIVEGAAETIDADMKRLRATQDAMINHHMTRGLKEQERHDKQQQKVSETLDLLKSITGESASEEEAYDKAAQLFNAVGKNVDEAQELFKTVKNAQAMNPDYKVNEAFSFITPDQDLRTKQEIIQSFATGKKGTYDPQVTTVQVPGILGMITKERDVGKQVRANLSTLGISSQADTDVMQTGAMADIKRAYIDPEAAINFKRAGVDLKAAESNLEISNQTVAQNKILLKNLPKKTRLEIEGLTQRNANAVIAGEQAQWNLTLDKKYSYQERKLGIQATEAAILSKGPKDLEEYSTQLLVQIDGLNKQLANTGNNPTERDIVNQNIHILNTSLIAVTKSMSDQAKKKVFSLINPESAYKGIFERTLSANGIGFKTNVGIDGKVNFEIEGTSGQEYVARLQAAEAFENIYGEQPISTQAKKDAQGNLNTLLTTGLASKIAKTTGTISIAPADINNKSRFDLQAGKIYDISKSTYTTVVETEVEGKTVRKNVTKTMIDYLESYGFKAANDKYAVWTGTNFRALK